MERALIVETHLVTRRSFRDQIHLRWNYQCAYCGSDLARSPTLDHIHPKVHGGTTEERNLVSCCLSCNSSKGRRDFVSWFREQDFYCPEREWAIHQWMTRPAA